MAQLTPIVYDDSTGEHRPAGAGEQVGVTYVPIDPSSANVIRQTVNGLMVDPDDLPAPLSTQDGNYLRYGNDHGLFCDGNDVLSNADDNLLRIDSIDKKLKVTAADVKAAVGSTDITVVSRDSNNLLRAGSDGGAYLNESSVPTGVSTDANNILTRGSDGKPYLANSAITVNPSDLVSSVPGNLLAVDYTGKMAVSPAGVAAGAVSTDASNLLTTDTSGKLTLTASRLVSGNGNNALTVGTDNKLYVQKTTASGLVDGNDKVLVVSGDGSTVSTVLNMSYNQTNGLLSLLGKDGQTVATVTVQASGSVLESAAIVVNPAGQPAGTYLAMTFRLADGTTNTVYANLSALADVYSAGAGIDITNYVISAKLDSNGGLKTTANGIAIDANALPALISDDIISSDSGNALVTGSDGLLYTPLDCGEL